MSCVKKPQGSEFNTPVGAYSPANIPVLAPYGLAREGIEWLGRLQKRSDVSHPCFSRIGPPLASNNKLIARINELGICLIRTLEGR